MSFPDPHAALDEAIKVARAANRAEEESKPNGHDHNARSNSPDANDRGTYKFKLLDASALPLVLRSAYLVKNLVPRQGLIVVWGLPKCGKSFWVLDLAFHIALGQEYRGRRVKQGLAVYVGCEGAFAVPARVEAFRQTKIRGPINPDCFKLILTRLDLVADIDRLIADIVAQIGDRHPAVIVIDTLNRSLTGSESSDEDMGNYVKAADKLRERFGCAVIIVHHCGLDSTRPRGHTSLLGAADAQIAVKKDRSGLITTEVEYLKDGPEGETTASRLKVIGPLDYDEDDEEISSCVLEEVALDWTEPSAPAKPAGKSPSPMAVKFHDVLVNVEAALAKPRPESGNRPSITEAQWRDELVKRGVIDPVPVDGDKRTAQNRQDALVSKYRRELVAANWLVCNNKIVWSIRKRA